MAKSKKSSKSLSNKINKVVKSDVFTSIAIVSVLLNLLFLIGVFVLTNTNTYNTGLFNSVRSHYCKNIDGLVSRAEELGDSSEALKEWRVNCVSKEFAPFYQEAVKKFEASSKN
jgi:hypothetical protein